MQNNKFIHFGCWNQGFCDKDDEENNQTPISIVMRQLDKTLKAAQPKHKHDFIIIAGDNYYPNKPEKKDKTEKKDSENPGKMEKSEKKDKTVKKEKKEGKTVIQANLKSGFNCLPSGIEINIILGNHDLETSNGDKKIFIENADVTEEEGNCTIMQMEQAIVSKRNETGNRFSLDLYKHKWLGDNTLVLMIDTSMYDTKDAESFLPCYNVKTGKTYENITELHLEQQEFVYRMITEYKSRIKNVIVIGHHPISAYKYKNEQINVIKSFPGLIDLFLSIKEKLVDKESINYYYLCADLHLYQVGTIKVGDIMTIKQYIVGTGGTKLDPSPFLQTEVSLPEDNMCFKNELIEATYTMTEKQIELSTSEKYGFLECELYKSKMYFKFIDIEGGIYQEPGHIIQRNTTHKKGYSEKGGSKTRRIRKK
jgi:hypothetical protein